MPLTINGKLDRHQLPPPDTENAHAHGLYVEPTTAEERTLCAIWQEVLGVPRVGINDNFFDLGGDSILALRTVSRTGVALGRRIAISALFLHPTVRSLSTHISSLSVAHRNRFTTYRHAGEAAPILFLVPPGSGNSACYRHLAASLPSDLTTIGLERMDFSSNDTPTEMLLSSIAADYASTIQLACPSGPYYLAGWSLGGIVAFEIAKQLSAAGHSPDRIIIIDSEFKSHDHGPDWVKRLSDDLETADRMERVRILNRWAKSKDALSYLEKHIGNTPTLDDPGISSACRMHLIHLVAAHAYRPEGAIPSIRYIASQSARTARGIPRAARFSELTKAFTMSEISAEHDEMLTPPLTMKVAADIAAYIGSPFRA